MTNVHKMTVNKVYKALDGWFAYDDGSDSGTYDLDARQEVTDYLNGLSEDDRRRVLVQCGRKYLNDSSIEQGYSLADVAEFYAWLTTSTDIDID